ncbi:hypothetical protein ANCCEY_13874, partial [Ancylostoma ceylanicum]
AVHPWLSGWLEVYTANIILENEQKVRLLRFATLASLRKEEHDSGEESDGGGERQGFFVGGSEHSTITVHILEEAECVWGILLQVLTYLQVIRVVEEVTRMNLMRSWWSFSCGKTVSPLMMGHFVLLTSLRVGSFWKASCR